jgi:hypothetical protein
MAATDWPRGFDISEPPSAITKYASAAMALITVVM